MLWYNHIWLLIWTVFSGERCGPWASCLSICHASIKKNLNTALKIWDNLRYLWLKSLKIFTKFYRQVTLFPNVVNLNTSFWLIRYGRHTRRHLSLIVFSRIPLVFIEIYNLFHQTAFCVFIKGYRTNTGWSINFKVYTKFLLELCKIRHDLDYLLLVYIEFSVFYFTP